jgi:hypothetical protein
MGLSRKQRGSKASVTRICHRRSQEGVDEDEAAAFGVTPSRRRICGHGYGLVSIFGGRNRLRHQH